MIGTLFEAAVAAGVAIEVEDACGQRVPLPMQTWDARPSGADAGLLERCHGATLDIGCGPGRFVAELTERGLPSLGIDVTAAAVARTRSRGALALQRDVFGPLPGDGRWQTALLADGNIGIGGDPVRLLRRVETLLDANGQALVELSGSDHGRGSFPLRLRTGHAYGAWFRWAEVGLADIPELVAKVGLNVVESWYDDKRWFVCLG